MKNFDLSQAETLLIDEIDMKLGNFLLKPIQIYEGSQFWRHIQNKIKAQNQHKYLSFLIYFDDQN